jgi:PAS domain S-box-containing protein
VDSDSRGVPDSTTQGEPSSLLSWFIDITTHKHSMQALQSINQQAATLLESMADGFIALDREWRYVYVNRRTEQLSGRTREELLGKNHWEVHPEAVGSLFDTMLHQAMDGQVQVDFEAYYPPFQRWYDVHVYPTQDVLCIYYCDITARKKTEEELRAFKLISDQANDGIVIGNREGRILYVNRAEYQRLGYTEAEYLQKGGPNLYQNYSPAGYQKFFDRAHREIIPPLESTLKRKDGTSFPIEISVTGVTFAGQPCLFGISRDITDRKQVEEHERRRAQYAALRADVGIALAEKGILQSMLYRCCQALVRHLPIALARIWTLDHDKQELELQASAGHPAHLSDGHHNIPVGDLKLGHILQERLPYLTNDASNDPQISHREWARRKGIVAFAGYPLVLDEQVVGVLAAYGQRPLAEETFEALYIAAGAIAQGIGRKWAEEGLEQLMRQRTHELSLLLAVSHSVASALEWESLLGTILEQLKTVVDYNGAILYSIRGNQLSILAYRRPHPPSFIQRLTEIFERDLIYEQMRQQREPLIIDDLHDPPQFVQAYLQTLGEPTDAGYIQFRSWMGVPLIAGERVIGMLTLSHHRPNVYTPRHASLAFALANQAAISLENDRLYKQARALDSLQERQQILNQLHDTLSGVLNSISMSADKASEALETDPVKAMAAVGDIKALVEMGVTKMRELQFERRTKPLESEETSHAEI